MPLEIERKFLCRWVSRPTEAEHKDIVQAYLAHGSPEIRIRTTGPRDDAELTIKRGHGLVREEITVPIPYTSASELLHERVGNLIVKTRYRLGRWEVDEYQGHFNGYMSAECELATVDETLPPFPPEILIIREITGEARYSNSALSQMSENDIRALGAEDYTAIINGLLTQESPA